MRNYKLLVGALLAATTAAAQTERVDTTVAVKVGYLTSNPLMLTGAVDKVTQERMNKGLVLSSLDAISGQAAGVQVTSGGNQEAMVSAVRVRGTTSLTGGNDPLVIIDGVTSDLVTLSTVYPAEIESFTILKDASETAQYGSRGASGVIEVTTKKGRNQPFQISYDGSVSVETVYKRMQMLNATQFRQAAAALGVVISDKGADTNFGRSMERTGFVQNHHVAFGGGSETANYRVSLGVMEHHTIIRTNNYRNYIAKLDISQKAFDNLLTVDLGMFGSLQSNNYLPFAQKLLYSAAAFNPTFPDGANADGSYSEIPEAVWISNPHALLKMKQDEDNAHFNVHLSATLTLAPHLLLRGFGSFSYNSVNNAHYYPTYVWSKGEAYRGNDKSTEVLGNVSIDYTLNTRHSALNMMALVEAESRKTTGFFTTVTNLSTDAFGYDKLIAGATRPWEGTDADFTDSHMESVLLHLQYTLMNRYTLTANARADASSKVGRNHRWGFFPSVSGAWLISNEKWMKRLRFIDKAKLRIGFGRSGNLGGIGSYNSMLLVQPNGVVPLHGGAATTLGAVRNANPDLRWEVKQTFNVGIDASFWNQRMALKVDYYRSKTTDMLYVYDVPVPPFTYDKLLANLGSMKNSGLEIGFGITPLRSKDMELTINMNWTFERNKLLSLDGDFNGQHLTAPQQKGISSLWGAGFHGGSDVVKQIVGEPLGVFHLPHCKGLVQDADGSYYYDVTSESYVCGQATPKALMGSNIAFRYKHWDVTMQVNGAFGHQIYNGTALTYNNMLSLPNYNVMQGAPEKNIQDQTISDYWLEDGDYVNIDYLTIGWNVPLKAKYVRSLRLSASVNNLATFTGYSGLTPMINSSIISGTLGIDDKNTMPVYRSYTLGLSITF
jgi:TonB-linked SusC/RagA family outer membrane protein